MPTRLRPTNPNAADAILVGDPGRALLLAQELIEGPKMSNHARGLWGYSGPTAVGRELTIQSTGIGGPSAAAVLADLAKLGLRRAIRIGTCRALRPGIEAGRTVIADPAFGVDGTSHALAGGLAAGPGAAPPPAAIELHASPELSRRLAGGAAASVLSRDLDPELAGQAGRPQGVAADVADLQTAALFALGPRLSIAIAALLVVEWDAEGRRLAADALDEAVKSAGKLAAEALAS